jgi:hypothetical protein
VWFIDMSLMGKTRPSLTKTQRERERERDRERKREKVSQHPRADYKSYRQHARNMERLR